MTQTSEAPQVPQALLLDSGGVLMQPIGGRWNPRADFEATVKAHVPHVTDEELAEAVREGDRFMAATASTPDHDDYHRAMLTHIGLQASPDLLAALVRDVPPETLLETFPEVIETLTELRTRGIPMAVVSDAWPNLPELHAAIGLAGFFDAYAISKVLGCTKPDPRMYHHASEALGLAPADCLFVDDDPDLVAAAIALGYQGRAMIRAEDARTRPEDVDVPVISSLTELLPLV